MQSAFYKWLLMVGLDQNKRIPPPPSAPPPILNFVAYYLYNNHRRTNIVNFPKMADSAAGPIYFLQLQRLNHDKHAWWNNLVKKSKSNLFSW
jgi:hypothetical protein